MEELGDWNGLSMALRGFGIVHSSLGEYAKALALQQRSLRLSEERGSRTGVSSSLGSIGNIHARLGAYDKALDCHRRALRIDEALGQPAAAAMGHFNIGSVYALRGAPREALLSFEKALELSGKLGRRSTVLRCIANLGVVHEMLGSHNKALDSCQRALKMARELGVRGAVARLLGFIGVIHLSLGNHAKALDFTDRCLALAGELGRVDLEAGHLSTKAAVHIKLGQPDQAVRAARRGVEMLPLLVGGLALEQGAEARGKWAELFMHGVAASWTLDDPAKVCFFLESGRAGALLESLGGRDRVRGVLIPAELRKEEASARAREKLALQDYRRVLKAAGDVKDAWKRVEQARAKILDAVARIQRAQKLQADVAYPRAASLPGIRRTLQAGEALVLYASFGDLVALVVTRDGTRMVGLGDAGKLLLQVEKLRAAVVRPDERGMRAPEHERLPFLRARLRKLLVEPLGLANTTTRVLVSSPDELAYVPFGLLCDREVVYVPSGTTYRLLVETEAHKRGAQVLALGDPDYGDRQSALPESGKEAKAVGDVVRLGKQATIAGLRATLVSRPRWRAVHFACHGLIDPERPALSSLALSPAPGDEGLLRCIDVFGLAIPADLVVLSACETAKGKVYQAEGVIGFVRAFMMAGAPRVIVSLWKVDDAATRALMEKFYALWKDSKMPAATALKKAQLFVRSQERWKHPYFWAAWQLWGLGE